MKVYVCLFQNVKEVDDLMKNPLPDETIPRDCLIVELYSKNKLDPLINFEVNVYIHKYCVYFCVSGIPHLPL